MSNNLAGLALVLLLELVAASSAAAQSLYADRFMLNLGGPCAITSGAAAPNGAMVGNVCDTYVQTATGAIWTKTSGTGTSSGWLATLAGQGTTGRLPLWSSATGLGDSAVSQAGGTVTITGAAAVTGTIDITGAATLRSSASITGDTTIGGNTTLGGWIGTASYASQVTGWRITPAGAADVRYLFTDELRAKLFTADQETVLAGSERITKSYSTVAFPFTCPAAGQANASLWVFDASTYGAAAVFQSGDWVVIHVLTRSAFGPFSISDCVGTVTSYADGTGSGRPGTQFWSFTRGSGANGGAMPANTVVAVNQLVQDLGVSGNGYVELSAVDGPDGSNAPYIQTNTWTGAPVAGNTTTQCRFGRLNGITGAASEFGMFCGTYNAPYSYVRLSNTAVLIRNLPVSLWDVTGNAEVFRIDPNLSLAMGNPIPAGYGGSNNGIWMGRDSADGLYKLRIGNPVGNRLTWNGSILSIVGEGSGITNINGGNIQAGTIQASQINVTPNGAALNNDPYCLATSAWAEQSNPGHQATSTRVTDGVVGNYSMRSQVGFPSTIQEVKQTPVDGAHKTYRLHAWVRAGGGGNGGFLLGVVAWNADGTGVGGVFAASIAAPISTTWSEVQGNLPFPATVTMASPIVYLNANGTTGWMEAQDIRLEEVLPSTLIKDGAITTAKIQAGAITATQIAANTITVANLNATGFGDNLILNSTFEGTTPTAALAGWSQDPAVPGGSIQSSCCGTHGAGTLLFTPPAGNGVIADYLAVPVASGPYRVALDVFTGAASPSGFNVSAFESTVSTMPTTVRASTVGLGAGEVARTSYTSLCNNCATTAGWQHFEWTYTPPAGVFWVSLAISDFGTGAQHIDGVEMQPQIGPGHIRANSITATQIAAGTITGDRIAARTIISGNIATGTISANEIGAGTITADRLAARTITAGYIASGTITANELAATSITADKLNVSSLSAISANLGTVTAGTINGVTINGTTINGSTMHAGGGNEVTIDSSGLTLASGNGTANQIKWTSGGQIYGSSSTLTLRGGDIQIGANNGSMTYFFESNAFQGAAGLGTQSIPWTSLFVTPPTNNAAGGGSSFYPLQLNTSDNQVHRKTNGYDGQCVITAGKSLYIDHGIVVGCV